MRTQIHNTLNLVTFHLVHVFFYGLDGRHRLTVALTLYAIYSVHNDFRHSNNHTDFKLCVMTALLDVHVNKQIRRAVADILEL